MLALLFYYDCNSFTLVHRSSIIVVNLKGFIVLFNVAVVVVCHDDVALCSLARSLSLSFNLQDGCFFCCLFNFNSSSQCILHICMRTAQAPPQLVAARARPPIGSIRHKRVCSQCKSNFVVVSPRSERSEPSVAMVHLFSSSCNFPPFFFSCAS